MPTHSHPPLDESVDPTPHLMVDESASTRRPKNHIYHNSCLYNLWMLLPGFLRGEGGGTYDSVDREDTVMYLGILGV